MDNENKPTVIGVDEFDIGGVFGLDIESLKIVSDMDPLKLAELQRRFHEAYPNW